MVEVLIREEVSLVLKIISTLNMITLLVHLQIQMYLILVTFIIYYTTMDLLVVRLVLLLLEVAILRQIQVLITEYPQKQQGFLSQLLQALVKAKEVEHRTVLKPDHVT